MNLSRIAEVFAISWNVVREDRTVHVGASASGVSLWGASALGHAQAGLALFAAFFGGLASAAIFVYTCIKIRRLVKNPKATE